MQHLIEWFSSPVNVGSLVAGALALAGGLFVHIAAERRAKIAHAIHLARVAAERVRDETPGEDKWDPIAAGLAAADRYLVEHGWRALDGREKETVRGVLAGAKAIHLARVRGRQSGKARRRR